MREIELVTLKELLPSLIASDPAVLAAAEAIDAELRKATLSIAGVSLIPRIREIANSAIIDLLAWQFHCDFYDPAYSLEKRRSLVAKSIDWHTRKGTPSAVEEVVTAAFSDGQIEEWFDWGGEPYWFRVTTEDPLEDEQAITDLIEAIWSVKNTRSWLDGIYTLMQLTGTVYAAAAHYSNETDTIGLRPPEPLPACEPVYVGVGVVIRAVLNIS